MSRIRREDNRELLREKQRLYRLEHAEECAARNKKWAQKNPEKMAAYHRKSRAKLPDSYRDTVRKYRSRNPDKSAQFNRTNRARRRGAKGFLSSIEWLFLLACFGSHCAKCGSIDRLTHDHIVPVSCGGTHTLENSQPLCVSCNSSKHVKTIDYRLTSPWFNREMYENGIK